MHSQTLPSNYSLVDLGPGSVPLALALVTDPCPWSPESPSLYELRLEQAEGKPRLTQQFGIRRFGVRDSHLFLNGKRFVIRGVIDERYAANTSQWREMGGARVLQQVEDEVLSDASRQGILSVVRLDEKMESDTLRQIALHVSTPLVVLSENSVLSNKQRGETPNLLLAQRMESLPLQPWADVAWIEFSAIEEFATRIAGLTLPIIAVRRYHGTSLTEARAEIDILQADLAPSGQFAGYVV